MYSNNKVVFFINFCQTRPISSSGSDALHDLTLLSGFKFLQVEQNKSCLIHWDRKPNTRFADLNFIYGMDYHALHPDDVLKSKFYNMFSPIGTDGIDISMVSTQQVQCKIDNTLTEEFNDEDFTVKNEVLSWVINWFL